MLTPRHRFLLALGLASTVALLALSAALAFPNASADWLSRTGLGAGSEAGQYYAAIGAPATFNAWKSAYGFPGAGDVTAIYYNAGDLGFGREMHCRKNGSGTTYTVACYVVNHGLGAATPVDFALEAALTGQHNLPVVAMTYSRALDGLADDVKFYIYDAVSGARLNSVPLDSEGEKFAPQMCLACHGGIYDSVGNNVYNANFLPFDAASFQYSGQAGYTLADQQEELRRFNAFVKDTNPPAQLSALIDGWYAAGGGVLQTGATFDAGFTPPGYAGDEAFYHTVVAPYCRSCHIAQLSYPLTTPAELLNWNNGSNLNAGYAVFHVFDMPHAELTSHNFWGSPAPAALADRGGWSYRVTRLDDKAPDGCQPTDCTLREAILAANTAGGSAPIYKAIITFAVDGVFTLTRAGFEDNAATGDLDITGGEVLLLGNGADRTVIDGGGLDRVFHIQNGAIVMLQGVTVQNGDLSNDPGSFTGGGLLNDGSQLTLNRVVVHGNVAPNGGGLSGLNGALITVNASAIVNNDGTSGGSGGGLRLGTGGTVTLNNSTLSGNTAQRGGGAYISDAGSTLTLNFSTVTGNSASVTGGGVRLIADGALVIRNSVLAGNVSADSLDCGITVSAGPFTSQGENLFGQSGSANGCGPLTGTDQTLAGVIGTVLSPSLTPARAGVPAHALVRGGPAVDAIPLGANCALPAYDVRDQARPLDGDRNGTAACDIGAVELDPVVHVFLAVIRR